MTALTRFRRALVSFPDGLQRRTGATIEIDAEWFGRLLWAAKDMKYLIDVQPDGAVKRFGNHGADVKTEVTYQEASRVIAAAEHVWFPKG